MAPTSAVAINIPVEILSGAEPDNVVPAANLRVPVIVSPTFRTLRLAAPLTEPKIVPMLKFPNPSRITMVLAWLESVGVVQDGAPTPPEV